MNHTDNYSLKFASTTTHLNMVTIVVIEILTTSIYNIKNGECTLI